MGAGRDVCKILLGGKGKANYFKNVGKGSLSGFDMSVSGKDVRSVVHINNSNVTVEGNRINGVGSYYSLVIKSDSEVIVRDNIIYGNDFSGILIQESKGEVYGNRIYGNGHYGIVAKEYANPVIRNNTIYGNKRAGIWATLHAAPMIVNNIVANSQVGITGRQYGKPKARRNIIYNNIETGTELLAEDVNNILADPLFVDAGNNDFRLRSGSPAIGAGEKGVDIGAVPYLKTN